MSEVIKCDRCGKTEWRKLHTHGEEDDKHPLDYISGTVIREVCPQLGRNDTADLCPRCALALRDLLFNWRPKFSESTGRKGKGEGYEREVPEVRK